MIGYLEERELVKGNLDQSSQEVIEKLPQRNGEILLVTRKSIHQHKSVHRFLYEGHFEGYTRNLLFDITRARDGRVRNPDQKDIYGFYIGKYVRDKYIYNIWKNMERRCYYPDNIQFSLYGAKGVTVSDSFKCYSFFERWYRDNWDGHTKLQLDKDVKSMGRSKIYSPETCILIPGAINTFIATLGERKGIEEKHNSINTTFCVHYRRRYKKINKNFKTFEEAKLFKRTLDLEYLELLLSQYDLTEDTKQALRNYVEVFTC